MGLITRTILMEKKREKIYGTTDVLRDFKKIIKRRKGRRKGKKRRQGISIQKNDQSGVVLNI